ncbi:sugar phosphate nucleotidyltransferase [Paenibacillus silviterrae]|uniref:sugar phosphate nucleotidyltransferase n=1 Tax=Paenibacillus silviterrae TaxID=3242194 RepID=UPI002542AAFF|nr:sugar phosphate nucleotidyltransferase [Paenibacillus chinjuensis]
MKGIILAGGQGTRLSPLTEITNKHLLPIGKEPMIWHGVKQLVLAGIEETLVVTSTIHMGHIVNSLGSGKRFGCKLTYKVQDEPLGIAHALSLAEDFANQQKIVVLLGDNIFEKSIKQHVDAFRQQDKGARVLLKKVGDPERFGIAALDEQQVISIEEKPTEPSSNFAVVGCYMYDSKVFDYIKQIPLSARGELEITSVNNIYIKKNELMYGIVSGKWMDAGTFESMKNANQMMLQANNKIME